MTRVVDATRALMLGGPTTTAVVKAVLWGAAMLAVFAPLAVAKYRRVA